MIWSPQTRATKAAGARKVPNGRANCRSFLRAAMMTTPTRAPAKQARMRVSRVLPQPRYSADHDHHGHVAHAQPFFLPDQVVGAVDQEQEPRPDGRAQQGLADVQVGPEEGVDQGQGRGREDDLVGQDLVVEVDEGQDDEGAREDGGGEERQPEAEPHEEDEQQGAASGARRRDSAARPWPRRPGSGRRGGGRRGRGCCPRA